MRGWLGGFLFLSLNFRAHMYRTARCLCSGRSVPVAEAVINAVHRRFAARPTGSQPLPPLPSVTEVKRAISAVASNKNGYLAWALYAALRQGEIAIGGHAGTALAGAMLHVDHELYGDQVAHRTMSVLEVVTASGEAPADELVEHVAAACALAGLPDRAEALLNDHTRRRGFVNYKLAGALIEACGNARQLPRGERMYRELERSTGRRPPAIAPAIALLKATAAAGDLDRAFSFLRELTYECGIEPRGGMLSPLLCGCARAGDVERALEVVSMAKQRGIRLENAAVREFARAGGDFVEPAVALYREARANGSLMSRGSVSKLVAACATAGDDRTALELLSGADGCAISTHCGEHSLFMRSGRGNWPELRWDWTVAGTWTGIWTRP